MIIKNRIENLENFLASSAHGLRRLQKDFNEVNFNLRVDYLKELEIPENSSVTEIIKLCVNGLDNYFYSDGSICYTVKTTDEEVERRFLSFKSRKDSYDFQIYEAQLLLDIYKM